MSAQVAQCLLINERETNRVPLSGRIQYRYGLDDHGTAAWRSIGRDGACISLGRYLRPGRHITLLCDGRSGAPEVSGRVVWCRPALDGQTFVAGVRFLRDDAAGPGLHARLSGAVNRTGMKPVLR